MRLFTSLVEKVWSHGARTLSDAELLAILLRKRGSTAKEIDTAGTLLDAGSGTLHQLCQHTPWELASMPGMCKTRATAIIAICELGRRRSALPPDDRCQVTDSSIAYDVVRPVLCDLIHEELHVLLLDQGRRVIDLVRVSVGGTDSSIADPRVIFRLALERRASFMILAHNHPGGTPEPSRVDMDLTKKLSVAGWLVNIEVADHLIVTQGGYYSFADNDRI
ncbi:MAG TPA: DNA repair protein RadC [Flavobacteriales bacterium]|nr:DNA repair protein RadC [Flavobacteriales bacterium]